MNQNQQIEGFEKEWGHGQSLLSPKELSEIFGRGAILEATINAIFETKEHIAKVESKIEASYEHSRRLPAAEPICQVVADILYAGEKDLIWVTAPGCKHLSTERCPHWTTKLVGRKNDGNSLVQLRKRLRRLEWQKIAFTAPSKKLRERKDAQEVKDCIDLKVLAESNGIKLKKFGKLWRGLCPFHTEKTPSFTIYPNNSWYCFGGCSVGGDAFDFVQRLNNVDFNEAYEFLGRYA